MKTLILAITVLLCMSPLAAEAVTAPAADVTDAAKVGLKHYLDLIPAGSRQEYDFSATGSLDKAYLGDPFNLHIITPDALFSYSEGVPVASILTPIDQWYFPVMMGNQIRCFLVVDRMDGRWEAVSLGYVTLAKFMNQIRLSWPAEKGYNPVLIAVFQAKKYLVLIPEAGELLLPVSPAQTASGSGQPVSGANQAAGILESLKPTVTEAIKQR
ncbi:MAG: hypothetical protein ACLQDI_04660 [Syntrophobacteraceae bacterium]